MLPLMSRLIYHPLNLLITQWSLSLIARVKLLPCSLLPSLSHSPLTCKMMIRYLEGLRGQEGSQRQHVRVGSTGQALRAASFLPLVQPQPPCCAFLDCLLVLSSMQLETVIPHPSVKTLRRQFFLPRGAPGKKGIRPI